MLKRPFIVPNNRPTSQRFTSISTCHAGIGRSTPDTISAEIVCPDVFNVMSWAKQTLKILTQERHFLPALKNWVPMPKLL